MSNKVYTNQDWAGRRSSREKGIHAKVPWVRQGKGRVMGEGMGVAKGEIAQLLSVGLREKQCFWRIKMRVELGGEKGSVESGAKKP